MEHYKLFLEDDEALELFTSAVNHIAQELLPQPRSSLLLAWHASQRSRSLAVRACVAYSHWRSPSPANLANSRPPVRPHILPGHPSIPVCTSNPRWHGCVGARPPGSPRGGPFRHVVSLDGRAAYDTIHRAAIFSRLMDVAPCLGPLSGRGTVTRHITSGGGDALAPPLANTQASQGLQVAFIRQNAS